MLVRSSGLSATMSRYLIQRLEENPKVELHFQTEVTGLAGRGTSGAYHLAQTRARRRLGACHPPPVSDGGGFSANRVLKGCLARDPKGFILTGRDLDATGGADVNPRWPLQRAPEMLETSLPGVFAVGDVRSGNVNEWHPQWEKALSAFTSYIGR
jgi:thioredoxin reductase (NADPH)